MRLRELLVSGSIRRGNPVALNPAAGSAATHPSGPKPLAHHLAPSRSLEAHRISHSTSHPLIGANSVEIRQHAWRPGCGLHTSQILHPRARKGRVRLGCPLRAYWGTEECGLTFAAQASGFVSCGDMAWFSHCDPPMRGCAAKHCLAKAWGRRG